MTNEEEIKAIVQRYIDMKNLPCKVTTIENAQVAIISIMNRIRKVSDKK